MTRGECDIERFEATLSEELISELASLWQEVYGQDYHNDLPVHLGQEKQYNHNIYYIIRAGGKVVASTRMTISQSDHRLGGLGEVATIPEYRGRGFAQKLCQQAADEFENSGGEAVFLGTTNPAAVRVYGKVGWQSLPNSIVMLRVTGSGNPQEYIEGYFQAGLELPVEIVTGSPRYRIGMIPLIVQPHEWVALDANVGLFSTRVRKQMSCMGLYPKYKEIEKLGKWFAAQRSDGATVGLASVRLIDHETAQVDGFTQAPQHFGTTAALYRLALQHLAAIGGGRARAVCAAKDELKQSVLTELGFRVTDKLIGVETGENSIRLRVYWLS